MATRNPLAGHRRTVVYVVNPPDLQPIIDRVRGVLTDDLLHPVYRRRPRTIATAGHCYVASEAVWWAYARDAGFRPYHVVHESESHWFLVHRLVDAFDDHAPEWWTVIDATHDQFTTPVPYRNGRRATFLTPHHPSARAITVMERMGVPIPA